MELTPEITSAIELNGTHAHDPWFFHKLRTDYGVQAKTAEDKTVLLELAAHLRRERDASGVKTANANPFLVGALDSLKGVLQANGSPVQTSEDELIKASAAKLAENTELQKAACVYGEYLQNVG